MVMPRDWIPPYPAGDERNKAHRAFYEEHVAMYPHSAWAAHQTYADMMLARSVHPKSGLSK